MAARSLEFRHLEVFRALMRTGTATGAGALLGVSQPAVSRLLAQTEALAGFPLFERVRGRLVPTALAHALHEEAERVFIGIEEISALAERLCRRAPRRVVVASVPLLTLSVLPRAARAWGELRRPEALAVHSRTVGGVLGMVATRQADLGLVTGAPPVPGVRSLLLARARAFCAMAPGHRLAALPLVQAADLDGEAYIALSREEGRQALVDAALDGSGAHPVEVAECRMTSGAAAMAAAGAGVTVVDAFAAAPFLPAGLVLRPFEPAVTVEYRLLWPEEAPDNFGRALLVQAIRAAVRSVKAEVDRHLRGAGAVKAGA
ncbi:LysR substrate-binding domain-containing protein [Roseomonas populi]|uniref:LysR substrate-binding domain-containing protein n=1 Tax=Roseomonas populi TaxID=3121582 RepID=A0ABT1X6T7_9PROT|nr:LysR substrate-binding domain-containing protein [Roseomonas pecuniae]MCR0982877.1 LysR substrate-binding domain-containing protein [Roseomonas pecuniae]